MLKRIILFIVSMAILAIPMFEQDNKSIAEILEANIELLLMESYDLPLPEGYSVLNITLGDLTGNGTRDIAVAIERRIGEWFDEERKLYVLFYKGNGHYKSFWQNTSLGGRGLGGMYGDSFSGINIQNGLLTISIFGGSSTVWGTNSSYKIIDGELTLYRIEQISFSHQNSRGIREIYYPISSQTEIRFYDDYEKIRMLISE